jgi:hypothetical protein
MRSLTESLIASGYDPNARALGDGFIQQSQYRTVYADLHDAQGPLSEIDLLRLLVSCDPYVHADDSATGGIRDEIRYHLETIVDKVQSTADRRLWVPDLIYGSDVLSQQIIRSYLNNNLNLQDDIIEYTKNVLTLNPRITTQYDWESAAFGNLLVYFLSTLNPAKVKSPTLLRYLIGNEQYNPMASCLVVQDGMLFLDYGFTHFALEDEKTLTPLIENVIVAFLEKIRDDFKSETLISLATKVPIVARFVKWIREVLDNRVGDASGRGYITNTTKLWIRRMVKAPSGTLATPLGLLNIKTLEVDETRHNYYPKTTVQPSSGPTPKWDAFMLGFNGGDLKKVRATELSYGYALLGKPVLRTILGAYAGAPSTKFILDGSKSAVEEGQDIRLIDGCRFIFIDELPDNAKFDQKNLKKLASYGSVWQSKILYKDIKNVVLDCVCFVGANDIGIQSLDDAVRDRITITKPHKYTGPRTPEISDHIVREEGPHILYKLLQIAQELLLLDNLTEKDLLLDVWKDDTADLINQRHAYQEFSENAVPGRSLHNSWPNVLVMATVQNLASRDKSSPIHLPRLGYLVPKIFPNPDDAEAFRPKGEKNRVFFTPSHRIYNAILEAYYDTKISKPPHFLKNEIVTFHDDWEQYKAQNLPYDPDNIYDQVEFTDKAAAAVLKIKSKP